MHQILFYGIPEGCSFGSIVALEWSGQPYRLCRIQMPEVVSSDAYRHINPVAETPTLLTENGTLLSESMAILNHIGASAIDKGLGFAQGSPGFDRLNAMLAFLNTSYFNAFSPLWYVMEHDLEDTAKSALTSYGHALVAKAHGQLEALLDGQNWLLGEQRSLADAYFCGLARWAAFHNAADLNDYPGLKRLHDRLWRNPAVQFAHTVEHEQPATSTGNCAGQVSLDEVLQVVLQAA